MQLVERKTLRSFAVAAAAITIGIGGSAGMAHAAPTEDPGPGTSSAEASNVLQTPLVTRYISDLAPGIATVHLDAHDSGTPGTTTLTVTDPISTLFGQAPQIDVHWRNLGTGTSGVAVLESDSARTEPVDVETGSGRIVVNADTRDSTIIAGYGTFSVD